MPKVVGSALTRANEFSAEGLHSKRRDTIIKHINSETHVNNKRLYSEKKTSLQQTIGSSFHVVNKRKSAADNFALKTTAAFLKANIPLEKIQETSIREWMNEFVEIRTLPHSTELRMSWRLPTVKTLREKYVPLVDEERFAAGKRDHGQERKVAVLDSLKKYDVSYDSVLELSVMELLKAAFENTRKRKHLHTQFPMEKYPDGTTKIIQFPVPVLTRWNSWFKSVLYVSEYLTDMIKFFSSKHAAQLTSLIDSIEGCSHPTSHILHHSKLLHVKECFAVAASGTFEPETTSSIEELGNKVLQAEVKQTLQRTASLSTDKLQEQMSTDPCQKTFAVVDSLFNPSSVVLNDVNNSLVT
ncbi:hypothetical protein PR048_029706 [Dryococelus australis]|uniref:Uncharacterized protein n=1 Tax=Dryococelus australis TaxID=614101 RepID=A0ABQ9GE52_9NEOP|nr:hypothetical protein PR048_029706 [Dryococelus australis]